MDAKRLLNEYCLANFHQPPTYETTRCVGSADHLPQWTCICKLPDGIMFSMQKPIQGAKKYAEETVAKSVIEYLKQEKDKESKRENEIEGEKVEGEKGEKDQVSVFVDCDNIAFCDAHFCARFPNVKFNFYVSFQRNMPFVDFAVKQCTNTLKREAIHNGSDVCDVMILFDVYEYVQNAKRNGKVPRAIIVSGDKLLYNAEMLLSPFVNFLGSANALEKQLNSFLTK